MKKILATAVALAFVSTAFAQAPAPKAAEPAKATPAAPATPATPAKPAEPKKEAKKTKAHKTEKTNKGEHKGATKGKKEMKGEDKK